MRLTSHPSAISAARLLLLLAMLSTYPTRVEAIDCEGIRSHIRWMIRRDLPAALYVDARSFKNKMVEDEFLTKLKDQNTVAFVAEMPIEPSVRAEFVKNVGRIIEDHEYRTQIALREGSSILSPGQIEETARRLAQDKRQRFAESEDFVVGHMLYQLHDGYIEIIRLAVHPSLRGKGIARQFIEHFDGRLTEYINEYLRPGRDSVIVIVREHNTEGQLFFRHMGFHATGIVEDHFGPGEHGYRFEFIKTASNKLGQRTPAGDETVRPAVREYPGTTSRIRRVLNSVLQWAFPSS